MSRPPVRLPLDSLNRNPVLAALVFGFLAGVFITWLWLASSGEQKGTSTPAPTVAAPEGGSGGGGPSPAWTVHFSPKGGCTDAVVEALRSAKQDVRVLAYSFTSKPIAQALLEAHNRGVHVEVILDREQRTDKYSEADFVAHAGIPTYIDDKHAIAHNKVMVIDGLTVITGSFNFTKQAEERNGENLLVIRDAALAAQYRADWDRHRSHSEPYAGR